MHLLHYLAELHVRRYIQMIFFSMLTYTIGSQGEPNKMTAANFF